jgi:uncharacterized protein (DUF885 family)
MSKRLPLFLFACAAAVSLSAAAAPASLETRRKALDDLLAEQWNYSLSNSPEFASILGDKRWNDKVSDLSKAQIDRDLAKTKEFLARFEAIDTSGFPEQEALNKVLMVRGLKEGIADARFKGWEMPVSQINGIHLLIPQLAPLLQFESVKDYEDLIARYRKVPGLFDQTVEHMRDGMRDGLMPPKFLLAKVVQQCEGLAAMKPEDSPFAEALKHFPKAVSPEDQARLRAAMLEAIEKQILPAYTRFAKFVREEYEPKGRAEPGMWSLPQGQERYAVAVERQTTSHLTPEEIHQIGLREVTRIEGRMLELAKRQGFKDLESFDAAIEGDPKLRAGTRQRLLDIYKLHIDEMWAKLPQLFGRIPKGKVEVRAVEEYQEKEASGARYDQGTPDGSRPGRVMVNTGDPEHRKVITAESTAYHEGVPGHHMQIAIQQELPGLPPFRQQGGYTAFAEGWALYSERLGEEVGFYKDPYSAYGHLQDEMLRAIRLVVDTGFHYKRWSRDQVVQFFHDHSALDEVEVQSETDRYIVWPGQALAYKIGQLKISELRERATKALGPRFDVRAFHDEILGAGALPLDVLESRIDTWIANQKKGAPAAP